MNNLLLAIYEDPYTWLLLVLVAVVGVMIFFQMRRRRAMNQQVTSMIDALRPGQRVKTVGGVIGRIKEIREEVPGLKTILLETGDPKNPTLVLYDIQAIYGVISDEAVAQAQAAAQATPQLAEQPAKVSEEAFDAKTYVEKSNKSRQSTTAKKSR